MFSFVEKRLVSIVKMTHQFFNTITSRIFFFYKLFFVLLITTLFYRDYLLFENILLNINIILRTPELGPTNKFGLNYLNFFEKFENVESKSIFQFINSITKFSEGLIFLIFESVDFINLDDNFTKYPFFIPSSIICAIVL